MLRDEAGAPGSGSVDGEKLVTRPRESRRNHEDSANVSRGAALLFARDHPSGHELDPDIVNLPRKPPDHAPPEAPRRPPTRSGFGWRKGGVRPRP
jgi:hypothetical protein